MTMQSIVSSWHYVRDGRRVLGYLAFGLAAWCLTTNDCRAISVSTASAGSFPLDANIVAGTPGDVVTHDTSNVDDSVFTLSQTFQAPSGLDLQNIFVVYGNNSGSPIDVGLEIFAVPDVDADTLPENPDTLLFNATFAAPLRSDNTVMALTLDTPVTLPATTGSAGYAIRFDSPNFRWGRSGGSNGSVYDGGRAYESGQMGAKGGGMIFPPAGRDFGLALSSLALPSLPIVTSVQDGSLNAGSTWSDGLAPGAANRYVIADSFTIASSATSFAGGGLTIASGGTLNLSADLLALPSPGGADFGRSGLEVLAGGTLNASKSGDFALGDVAAPVLSELLLQGTMNVNASPGADFFLDVTPLGEGTLNFVGNGAGSDMYLTAANSFGGTLRFNGSGDTVQLVDGQAWGGVLEMNSTGANALVYASDSNTVLNGTLVFNQPGVINHASVAPPSGGNARLRGPNALVANATVTVDLTKTFPEMGPTNERRLFIPDTISGSADIIVNGTAADPTGGQVTLNEFEVESEDESPSVTLVSPYEGTLTANNYVAVEMHQAFPKAKFVVNQNAVLELGFRQIDTLFELPVGEIQVNNGGTLVVGYAGNDDADGIAKHVPQGLVVTSAEGRTGNLTLANGSRTILQISGSGDNDFDHITVEGDAVIDGTLTVLINPELPSQTNHVTNGPYAPTLGDVFEIVSLAGGTLSGDLDANGVVDSADLDLWASALGVDDGGDANGDGLTDGADFLLWQQDFGGVAAPGTLSGTFDAVVIDDPANVLSGAGLQLAIRYAADVIALEVVAASGGLSSIPEPAALSLLALATGLLAIGRRAPRRQTTRVG